MGSDDTPPVPTMSETREVFRAREHAQALQARQRASTVERAVAGADGDRMDESTRPRLPELLETVRQTPTGTRMQGNGWIIEEDRSQDRVIIQFKVVPTAETFARLRANGFRWSPSRRVWVRMLSNGGSHAARAAVSTLRV